MKQTLLMDKYPIYTIEVSKADCVYSTVDEIMTYLKEKIAADPVAAYIGDFDHLAHTQSLEEGEVAPDIKAAKVVVFCFGIKLPKPEMLAVRPRSIAVADMGDSFVLSFMEAPMNPINVTMQGWIKELHRVK